MNKFYKKQKEMTDEEPDKWVERLMMCPNCENGKIDLVVAEPYVRELIFKCRNCKCTISAKF